MVLETILAMIFTAFQHPFNQCERYCILSGSNRSVEFQRGWALPIVNKDTVNPAPMTTSLSNATKGKFQKTYQVIHIFVNLKLYTI